MTLRPAVRSLLLKTNSDYILSAFVGQVFIYCSIHISVITETDHMNKPAVSYMEYRH